MAIFRPPRCGWMESQVAAIHHTSDPLPAEGTIETNAWLNVLRKPGSLEGVPPKKVMKC